MTYWLLKTAAAWCCLLPPLHLSQATSLKDTVRNLYKNGTTGLLKNGSWWNQELPEEPCLLVCSQKKTQISPWSCRTDCSALFLSPSVDGTISPQYYLSLPVWSNTGTTVEMGLNGWKPVSCWPSSGPDSPPPNTLHHRKEGIMHFWTGQMHATSTLQESQWPCKAQSNGKARFWVISDHRDLQVISHCMGHHPMWS